MTKPKRVTSEAVLCYVRGCDILVEGVCIHVAAKMASHTLRILLRQRFGIDMLTFSQVASEAI